MKTKLRIFTMLITISILVLAACGNRSGSDGVRSAIDESQSGEENKEKEGKEETDPIQGDKEGEETGGKKIDETGEEPQTKKETITCYEDLKKEADFLIDLGDECAEDGRDRHAVYFYSLAAAHTSAIRYMVDNILWLKGEGTYISDLSGNRIGDWREIGALNYAASYADYCQYLLLIMQGKTTEALTFLERAAKNPDCPPENAFFEYKDMSVEELYALKTKLQAIEDELALCYQPYLDPLEEITGFEFFPEFHRELTSELVARKNFADARRCAERAIAVDPFDGGNYVAAALVALSENEAERVNAYLTEGLLYDPSSASVHAFLALLARQSGDKEKEELHLKTVKAAQKDALAEKLLAFLEGGER